MPKGIKGFQRGNKLGTGRPKMPKISLINHLGKEQVLAFYMNILEQAKSGDMAAAKIIDRYLKHAVIDHALYLPDMNTLKTQKDINGFIDEVFTWVKDRETSLSPEQLESLFKLLAEKRLTIEASKNEEVREKLEEQVFGKNA